MESTYINGGKYTENYHFLNEAFLSNYTPYYTPIETFSLYMKGYSFLHKTCKFPRLTVHKNIEYLYTICRNDSVKNDINEPKIK